MKENLAPRTIRQIFDSMGCLELELPSPRRPLKTVRQILDKMEYSEKVPKQSNLAQKIGNNVKLAICKKKRRLPKVISDSSDAFPVVPYEEKHWNVIEMIVRVTVAEEYLSTESMPVSPFTVDESSIFGTEPNKLVINRNNFTTKYLFPLLSFKLVPSGRLKQSFECDEERDDYQKRIVMLMNAVWMLEEINDPINLDEKPYIWCCKKDGNVNKVIADLTELVRFKGNYGGKTLEDLVKECGQEVNGSWRDSIHYKLEALLGYKVFNRVLQISSDAPCVSGKWPPIVLDKEEAQEMKKMLDYQYLLDEIVNFSDVDSDFGGDLDDENIAKVARIL